ncbi:cAMP receptor protein [compost metagenome]
MCEDLKESENEKIALVQKTVKQRLAETLLHLHDEFGEDADKTLKVQLTREELAGIIGTATESCIRLLSDFNKLGLIELVGKKIMLKDVRALKKLADN